jgi:hypothetical protein
MKVSKMLLAGLVVLASCQQKEILLSKQQIKFKADSIFQTRVDELNRAAAEDLDRRQSIEVKTKADSIVDAYTKEHPITPIEE